MLYIYCLIYPAGFIYMFGAPLVLCRGQAAVLALDERRELPQDKIVVRKRLEPGPGEYSPSPTTCNRSSGRHCAVATPSPTVCRKRRRRVCCSGQLFFLVAYCFSF